jgi:hypothetical protein
MTEQTDLLQQVTSLLNQSSQNPALAGWAQQQPPQSASLINGVAVPVKIQRGRGNIKILLMLPAECASSPAALHAALDQLENAGIPLDVWEPKESGWGSGGASRGGWRR